MCAEALNGAAFGLLGEKLGHSWSRQIHLQLGCTAYAYAELPRDEAARFIREGAWTGINVTIPYKALAAELADERSPRVEATGAANTLVRRDDGRIFAENTDVIGFSRLLERFCARELGAPAHVALADAKALVLGSGGAAAAVVYALAEAGARPTVISRTGDEGYEGLAERHADAALIVNATPVGMYPDCPQSPLPTGYLASFPQLKGVIDVIYNPLATGLLLEAAELGHVSNTGLRQYPEYSHWNGCADCNDESPVQSLSAKECNKEYQCIAEESGDYHFLLSDLRGKFVYYRILTYTESRHRGSQYECPCIFNSHQLGLIERQTGLEECKSKEVNDIAVYEASELSVLECLEKR